LDCSPRMTTKSRGAGFQPAMVLIQRRNHHEALRRFAGSGIDWTGRAAGAGSGTGDYRTTGAHLRARSGDRQSTGRFVVVLRRAVDRTAGDIHAELFVLSGAERG